MPETGRTLVAKVREKLPGGPGLTVIDYVKVRLPLGSLRVGQYDLEIHVRADGEEEHRLVQTLKLTAR